MRPKIAGPSVHFDATSGQFDHWPVFILTGRQWSKRPPKEEEGNRGRNGGTNRPPCGSAVLGQVCLPPIQEQDTGNRIRARLCPVDPRRVPAGAARALHPGAKWGAFR